LAATTPMTPPSPPGKQPAPGIGDDRAVRTSEPLGVILLTTAGHFSGVTGGQGVISHPRVPARNPDRTGLFRTRAPLHRRTAVLFAVGMLLVSTPLSARSWESLGPEGGDRFLVRISPEDPRSLFVVGHHGVHRSRDAGENWELVSNPAMGRDSFLDVAFAATNPSALLVAGAETGVWYSPDEGMTWQTRSAGLPEDGADERYFPVTSLVTTSGGTVFAAMAGSRSGSAPPGTVYRSDNLGVSWIKHDAGIGLATAAAVSLLSVDSAGRVWGTVSGRGVYLYKPGAWQARNGNLPQAALGATFLAHDPVDQNRLLLGTESSWVWETADGGASWSQRPLPAELSGLPLPPLVYTVVIDPSNPAVVLVRANDSDGSTEHPLFRPTAEQTSGGGLYLSSDGGATWARRSVFAFRLTPDPTEVIEEAFPGGGVVRRSRTWFSTAGGRQSLFRSSDGFGTLDVKTKGIQTIWMNDVWVHPAPSVGQEPTIIGASESGLFRLTGGPTGGWGFTPSAGSAVYTWGMAADPGDSEALFYATGHPSWTTPELMGVYRLPLSCFEQECSPADHQILSATGLWRVVTTPAWPRRLYVAGQERGVLVSGDGGQTWIDGNRGITLPASITDLVLDAEGDPRLASFRTSSGRPGLDPPHPWQPQYGEPGGVYAFNRPLQQWVRMSGIRQAVFNLEVVHGDPLAVYAASSAGVYRLNPPGPWTLISLPVLIHDVAVDPHHPTHLYAATPSGVMRTTDGGAHWQDVSEGLPVRVVYALEFDPSDGSLYAATEGAGLQRLAPDPNPVPLVVSEPVSLDFGSVPLGIRKDLDLTFTNSGEADLVITSIVSTHPGFSVPGVPFPVTITPGSWLRVKVRFAPSAAATDSGTLIVAGNAANAPLSVPVQGVAYSGSGSISVTVDPPRAAWIVTTPWGATLPLVGSVNPWWVPTGTYQVVWQPMEGYAVPVNQPALATVVDGQAVNITGVYRRLSP